MSTSTSLLRVIRHLALFVISLCLMLLKSYSCLASNTICTGESIPIRTVEFSPYMFLRGDGFSGWFLIDTGASFSWINRHLVSRSHSSIEHLSSLSFPFVSAADFQVEEGKETGEKIDNVDIIGSIGTDILSLVTVEFDYNGDVPRVFVSPTSCASEARSDSSLISINQRGYYSRDFAALKAKSANVPQVRVKIGAIDGRADLDTGNELGADGGPIFVNSAMMNALREHDIALEPAGDSETPMPCLSSQTNMVHLWRVSRADFQILSDQRVVIDDMRSPLLAEMPRSCLTLSDTITAAANIPASYLRRWGTVIIDARDEQVWIRRPTSPPSFDLLKTDVMWHVQDGWGVWTDLLGNHYEGDWKGGERDGQGVERFVDGTIYDGHWRKDHADGHGTLKCSDGRVFTRIEDAICSASKPGNVEHPELPQLGQGTSAPTGAELNGIRTPPSPDRHGVDLLQSR